MHIFWSWDTLLKSICIGYPTLLRVEAGHIEAFLWYVLVRVVLGHAQQLELDLWLAKLFTSSKCGCQPGTLFSFCDSRFHFHCLQHCIAAACLKTWKRFLAAPPVTAQPISNFPCAFFSSSRYPSLLSKNHACYHYHFCYNTVLYQSWARVSFFN